MLKEESKLEKIKEILYILCLSLLGILAIIFTVLYLETFGDEFVENYSPLIMSVSVGTIITLTILSIVFFARKKQFVHKICFLTVFLLATILLMLYLLKITGFLEKIDSVEDLRNYITSFGSFAVILFILIQFLQVVILPIPSFITVGAGVIMFGAFWGAVYSVIGIILGSLLAFFLGRVFGKKLACWLVGKKTLDKGLKVIEGKDKIILTFMFLFPFFPDDALCFIAGVTSISSTFFITMIFITRLITVFVGSYSMNNSIIPYDTWWGILLWVLLLLGTIILTVLIYKKGENIEKQLLKNKKDKVK